MLLTDTVIDTAKATTKPFKLRDGKGMYLLIMPNGSKYFRLDYRLNGKRQTLALGVYPETSLEVARANRDIAKNQIKDGIKPKSSAVKKTVSTKINTVIYLERELSLKDQIIKDQRKIIDEQHGKFAAAIALSSDLRCLTKEQQERLFTPESPEIAKLKELSQLSVDRGIGDFEDAELIKELERRGIEVPKLDMQSVMDDLLMLRDD
jgi:hypothetical protein